MLNLKRNKDFKANLYFVYFQRIFVLCVWRGKSCTFCTKYLSQKTFIPYFYLACVLYFVRIYSYLQPGVREWKVWRGWPGPTAGGWWWWSLWSTSWSCPRTSTPSTQLTQKRETRKSGEISRWKEGKTTDHFFLPNLVRLDRTCQACNWRNSSIAFRCF